MSAKASLSSIGGIWSASPTPFTDTLRLDVSSVRRLVEHHLRLGVQGLFLAGTAGEGPPMPDAQRRDFLKQTVRFNRGRLLLAMQTTDNSAARVLDRIAQARDEGADLAVVAEPHFFMNPSESHILAHFMDIFDRSPLPVGFYDRGGAKGPISHRILKRILGHPRVVLLKDSSSDPERRLLALAARRLRPELKLLNGNEFMAAEYMLAGYDGLLLGGGIFNGYLAGLVARAAAEGRAELAHRISRRICRINYTVFGGRRIACWLSGQKRLCVELGIFRSWASYYDYPLTKACERAIVRLAERESDPLRGVGPGKGAGRELV